MPRPARAVPRSRALTLLAWLLCALLGPGPALPALHFALVAHRVCPEHGELEHVEPAPELTGRASLAGAARAAPSGAALSSERAGSDKHGHEPCDVGGVAGNVAVLPAARGASAAPDVRAPSAPSGTEHAHHGIALLRYAPKLAPPAHA